MVDLKGPGDAAEPAEETAEPELTETADDEADTKNAAIHAPTVGASVDTPLKGTLTHQASPEQAAESVAILKDKAYAPDQRNVSTAGPVTAAAREASSADAIKPPPLRTAGEFLATEREKLTYQISMFGFPVGDAELEAKNERGEVKITLKVTSSSILSSLYPVDDFVETRHIGGNFIITKIRQQEGSFVSNRGFTIFLRDKKVFWHDLLTHKSSNETVPTSEVLDLLSSFYLLRGKPLQVGESEMLHVYDSDRYVEVPVQVLNRERVRLPGFRNVDAIVIKPLLKTDGIFKRTGDVTIWLTDDAYRVPVKVETEIPLGKVRVELLAAETVTGKAVSAAFPAEVKR